jgi:hypothetical protein
LGHDRDQVQLKFLNTNYIFLGIRSWPELGSWPTTLPNAINLLLIPNTVRVWKILKKAILIKSLFWSQESNTMQLNYSQIGSFNQSDPGNKFTSIVSKYKKIQKYSTIKQILAHLIRRFLVLSLLIVKYERFFTKKRI